MIDKVTDIEVIGAIFKALPKDLQKNKEIIQFCKDKKAELIQINENTKTKHND